MKPSPRIVAIPAIAALMVAAGCSGSGEQAETDNLVIQTNWTESQPQNAPLVAATEQFTDETGISVELLYNSDDLNQAYESAALAGEEADVVLLNLTDRQMNWATDGIVVPLNDQISEWGLDEVIPEYNVEEWTDEEGNLRGIPYTGFSWPWWFNTDLLAEAGVSEIPTTTDELVSAVTALRDAGITPMAAGGNDWSGQKLFLQIMQSYLPAGEAVEVFKNGTFCESDGAMRGIELFAELRDAGLFVDGAEGYTVDDATTEYFTGQAAMASMGSWSYLQAPEEIIEVTELGGFPGPGDGEYASPTAYQGATGSGFWVSHNGAEKMEAVEQFITFMYRDEVIDSLLTEGGIVPLVLPEGSDAAESNPLLAEALTTLPESVDWAVMPDLHIPASATNPMYRSVSIAFSPGNDAAAICAAMEEAYSG
ncbi:ABC transporter substrate-binding protein [Ruania halotolerans]|uniref:ABC transporter substrate-binding protein n=1 Tax=Ruania halotolerans TaxID=2897773 RepID=UPI001E52C464|nr:ABC transporter substrate-binding protein [Ruania halotolerans]UFU05465.1 ABC transporter substrate-binding protein [Ruania halotolerans]